MVYLPDLIRQCNILPGNILYILFLIGHINPALRDSQQLKKDMQYNKYSGAYRQNRRPNRYKSFGRKRIDRRLYIKRADEITKIEDVETKNSFADFGLKTELTKNIKLKGYVKPTQIQDQVIPEILKGRDILGIADTGTGKTAAFALPLIEKVLKNPNERILIMAPTRELAMQIKQEFRSFTWGLRVYITLAIGGSYLGEQIKEIRRGPHIIVGTPGRIKDLGKRRVLDFSKIDTLVLDEVDRMLDMGFIGDIKSIVDQTPKSRQTLFFSATVDNKVERLIDTFLNNPVKISIKSPNPSSHVEQNIVRVGRNMRVEKLKELVSEADFKKVLIFGSTQITVERLATTLIQTGFRAEGLHGGKRQNVRQKIVKSFKENQINILVATDVAARGLDISDITHVINFDEPNNYQDYIHRIGRTGRGNNKGFAFTFVE